VQNFPIEVVPNPVPGAERIAATAIHDLIMRKDAEKNLAQTEAKYRGLLEAAPDAMVVVNQDGEIVHLNVRAKEQFGYSRGELVGQKVTTIIPEGFAERLVADGLRSAAEAFAQQIGSGIELHGRRKNGSEFPIEIMLSPLDSAEGILVTAAIRDITKRKDAERHLAQTEAKYRGLLEAAPDAMVVVNRQGEIVLLNIRANEQFGYERGELLGQKVTTIIPEGFAERLAADGRRSAAEALAQQIGTGIELHGRRKNGGEFPIEIMLSPLDSAEGILVTAAIRDITKRKDAEKHLAQTEARYRGLLEAAPDAMVVVNQHGEIVLLNITAEKQFGYSRDELLGQKVTTIIPEGFAERLIADGRRSAAEALAQQIGTGIELHGRRKNGGEFPIEIMLSPLDSPEGILVTAAIRDITTRKDAEKRSRESVHAREVADQANLAKSRFLAGITHELRTPLHGILGYAELLSLEGGLNPTQSERLEAMMTAGQYLLGTINAVLDMSQIEADQMELRPVEIELPNLVRTCLDVVRPAAEAKQLALVLAPTVPLRLVADPTRLQQVLINLLGNAVKFTPAGAVEVRLRKIKAGVCIRLEVADTGPGISAQHRDKLFQTFERLNAEVVSGIEGTGLGLAIAARLVRLMGGRIGYADNPGGGSVFWLELPRGAIASAEIQAAAPSPLAARLRLRVLVADDEALNRNIASGFLRLAGHEVVCVGNGTEALEAATAGDFDVILMDVRMPIMNGLEATRRIRALPGSRGKVRVVAVTAQAFAQQIEICREAGMDGHVSKPFKQTVLLAALESITRAPGQADRAMLPPATAPADACGADPEAVCPKSADPQRVDPECADREHAVRERANPGYRDRKTADSDAKEPRLAMPEPEVPVYDRAAYEDIQDTLSAADLAENLQTLITRGEALLFALRMPEMLSRPSELADAAHKLAGGAGTFGFLSLAAAARRFEVVADTDSPERAALADHLGAAIKVSIAIVQQELAAMTAAAT